MLSSRILCVVPATLAIFVSLGSASQKTPADFNIRQYQAFGDGETLELLGFG